MQRALEYNSQREDLIISEHGRHVQKLINHAKTIEDKQERQNFVESVIQLMDQMSPQAKSVADHKVRLWKHVFRIANYDLDVTPPEGVDVSPEAPGERPKAQLGYPKMEKKYRHYGHNVQELVRKALSMEEGEKRDAFVEIIGSYMKLAYRTWNSEHYVNDEIIMEDLKSLSNGQLSMSEDMTFNNLKYVPNQNNSNRRKGKNNNNNKKKNNNNNNNRKKKRSRVRNQK